MKNKIILILIAHLTLLVASSSAQVVLWPRNGHYYEFVVTNSIWWANAKTTAEGLTHEGLPGHLATITSAAENEFITTTFGTSLPNGRFTWLGGYAINDQTDGVWLWFSGPEDGTQFSHFEVPTTPFYYENWGGIEPNHNGDDENYLMLNLGAEFAKIKTGEWGDAMPNPNPADPVVGYLVEYESIIAPPSNHLAITPLPEAIKLSFLAESNTSYQIEYKSNLTNSTWMSVGNMVQGDGTVRSIFDVHANITNRFFRYITLP